MSLIFMAFDEMDKNGIKNRIDVFEKLASANENVAFDMSRVRHLDGTGIGAVAYVQRRLRAHGYRVRVINPSEPAKVLLRDLGLTELLQTG
jgi:anti-anti-sigma regulatory factor